MGTPVNGAGLECAPGQPQTLISGDCALNGTHNQKRIFHIIKEFTGQANILTIPRVFVDYTGFLETGLFLSQVVYWSDRNPRGEWFYKSYRDWSKEICLSEYQVRRCANILKAKGILETKVKRANGSPTLHYRLKVPEFSVSFLKKLKKRNLKNSRNNNRDYTEIKRGAKTEDDLFTSLDRQDRLAELHWQANQAMNTQDSSKKRSIQ